MPPTLTTLPKITRYLGMTRGDSMQEICPHCGAKGTVIHQFECEDGTTRGAMSGCIQLFPVSPLARKHRALVEKRADYARKGWDLNKSEAEMLSLIEQAYDGQISTADAEAQVARIDARLAAWRQQKYGGRRRR